LKCYESLAFAKKLSFAGLVCNYKMKTRDDGTYVDSSQVLNYTDLSTQDSAHQTVGKLVHLQGYYLFTQPGVIQNV
jgi:hypothetical protein